ncbi:MAG: sirohydrochlorin cobaltochelatase [Candidatus Humimicrobiaceae bacterium]
MKKTIVIIVIICLTVVILAGIIGCSQKKVIASKPVILIAAFGSSMESGEKNLADADKMIREKFPEYEIRWAFTAQIIIDKLKKAGKTTYFDRKVPIQNLEEAYAQLIAEGKTNVVVQCLHTMVGAEFRQVVNTPAKGLNVKYGFPLLFDPENIQNAVIALSDDFGDASNTATILCAHGNEAHPENNAQLIEMDNYLRSNYKNTFLACVEGPPEFEGVLEDVLNSGVSNVKFVPLMLTYGDHISNDVMGDEPDSWKMQIGLPATAANAMGSNPIIIGMFIKEIKSALSQF